MVSLSPLIQQALLYGGLGFGLGCFFGLLRWAQEFIGPTPPPCKWYVTGIKGATSGSVGFLTTILGLESNVNIYLGTFLVALAGWGGVETLNALKDATFDVLRKWVGKGAEADDHAQDH